MTRCPHSSKHDMSLQCGALDEECIESIETQMEIRG